MELEYEKPDHIAVHQYKIFKQAAGKTAKTILVSAAVRLAALAMPQFAAMTFRDDMDFGSLGERKRAIFCVIPVADGIGKSFLKSYIGVCMEGAVVVLACIIFTAYASSGTPVIDAETSVITQVWSYLGETIFNLLVLVGLVKAADRIAKEMFGV